MKTKNLPFPVATVNRLERSIFEHELVRSMGNHGPQFFADYLVTSDGLSDLTLETNDVVSIDFALPPVDGDIVLLEEEELGQCICVYNEHNPPGYVIGVVFAQMHNMLSRNALRKPISLN